MDTPIDTTAGVTSAMSGLDAATQADTAYAAADLPEASAGYKDIQSKEMANLGAQFNQPAPQPQSNPLGRLFPLLAIAAFGGKSSKLDAGNMLAATTGVVKGYLAGNAEAFQSAEQQYQDAYKRFKDRQEQTDKIFKEMREAYKGRIDADVKALQFARQLTHDEQVAAHQTAQMAATLEQSNKKLDLESAKADSDRLHQRVVEQALLKNADSNRIRADASAENANTHRENASGAAKSARDKAAAQQLATSTIPVIDETIKLIESRAGKLGGSTGVSGFARSAYENVSGSLSQDADQTAHKVQSNLTTLTAAASHMAGLRPSIGAMKEFAHTLGSQGFGSNDASTLQNLKALKSRLEESASAPDTGSVMGGGVMAISGPDKPVGFEMQAPDTSGGMMNLRSLGSGKWEIVNP